jgi:hypothetical protein
VPKIYVDWEDEDALEDLDMPKRERIQHHPKEEKLIPKPKEKQSRYNPDAAARKEYVESE